MIKTFSKCLEFVLIARKINIRVTKLEVKKPVLNMGIPETRWIRKYFLLD